MLRLFTSTFLVFTILQCSQADDSYLYNFKMPQYYADIVSTMEDRINNRIDDLVNSMVKNSRFIKVEREYKDLIRISRRSTWCYTTNDTAKWNELHASFMDSRKECQSQADCKTDLAETTGQIVNTIQGFDADAFKEVSACTDEACKLKVYDNTHEKLFKLYQESMPVLRVTVDQAVSNSKCYSSMIQCMIEKNRDSLKEMYSSIAKLENCLATSGKHANRILATDSS